MGKTRVLDWAACSIARESDRKKQTGILIYRHWESDDGTNWTYSQTWKVHPGVKSTLSLGASSGAWRQGADSFVKFYGPKKGVGFLFALHAGSTDLLDRVRTDTCAGRHTDLYGNTQDGYNLKALLTYNPANTTCPGISI